MKKYGKYHDNPISTPKVDQQPKRGSKISDSESRKGTQDSPHSGANS